jgi:hypothetical protein
MNSLRAEQSKETGYGNFAPGASGQLTNYNIYYQRRGRHIVMQSGTDGPNFWLSGCNPILFVGLTISAVSLVENSNYRKRIVRVSG